ncbi:MAG TPA: hypothetical protein PKN29_10935 [Candidatus Ozemobacteraceae bacterium]|nr:hypothetical protein [Candidatus Ozemobacteraceae bacterium]
MPDENLQNQTGAPADAANMEATAKAAAGGSEKETEKKPDKEPAVSPPSVADDLLQLEKLNLMRAVMLRLQGGRHPNTEIDALLQRRLDLRPEDFQGPYAIRLICTLMMIFLICIIMWGIIWLLGTAMEWSYFLRLMSTGIATLLATGAGVAIFHPASVPDEKQVKETIARRLAELKDMGASQKPSEAVKPAAATSAAPTATAAATTVDEPEDEDAVSQLDAVAPETVAPPEEKPE